MAGLNLKLTTKGMKPIEKLIGESKKTADKIFKGLFIGANNIRNEIITSMQNTVKAAWFYVRGNKKHNPSAPGNPPAIDSGELLKDISIKKGKTTIEVGALTNPYAQYLEDPDKLNRPFLDPALEKFIPSIETDIKNVILRNIK